MTGPSYPAARAVARRIDEQICSNTAAFHHPKDAPRPDTTTIEEIISTAFWASLRREEGKTPRISVAFLAPEMTAKPLHFTRPFRLEPHVLAHLAAAVELPGIHLGVWWYENGLCVWGITRTVPTWCFVLEVVSPGLLVVKYRRPEPSTKFANVAVLEGDEIKFIEQQPAMNSEAPPLLGSLFDFYSSAGRDESDNFLIRVATSMRAYGRGGCLLVVPRYTNHWLNSVVRPLQYSMLLSLGQPGTLLHHDSHSVDMLTGLTAVDGATVVGDDFQPLAFGVKILAIEGARRIEKVLLTEPIEGVPDITVEPSQLGGTRHLSAAQFAHDQRDAVALVASQDGRFTVFAWSPMYQMVHAHRLEALLM
jgi:hypothetical protein